MTGKLVHIEMILIYFAIENVSGDFVEMYFIFSAFPSPKFDLLPRDSCAKIPQIVSCPFALQFGNLADTHIQTNSHRYTHTQKHTHTYTHTHTHTYTHTHCRNPRKPRNSLAKPNLLETYLVVVMVWRRYLMWYSRDNFSTSIS